MKDKNYLLIISFIIVILVVPLMGMIKSDYEFSAIENRKLQSFPVLGEEGIEGFTANFENYVVDQFPNRNALLDLYTKSQLFAKKIKVRNAIVIDDLLLVKDYRVNGSVLDGLGKSLRKVVTEHKETNFSYVILPNKTGMIAELHPKYIDGDISRTNNETLKKSLGKVSGLNIVNVYDEFYKNYSPKERSNYYYTTDFHWNAEGAYKAFEIMVTKTLDFDTFKSAEGKLKKVEYKDKYFKGDLERRFSGNIKNNDTPDNYLIINTQDLAYFKSIDNKNIVSRSEIVSQNIDQDEVGYNDIYTLNLGSIRVNNSDSILDKKAIILKDSYFNAMIDPISTLFSELIIIDPRYYNEEYNFSEIMKMNNPDYVFFFYHQSNVDKDLMKFLED